MAYQIPKQLKKYANIFLWNLTFNQFIYAFISVIFALIVFTKTPFTSFVKISLSGLILAIGALFVYGHVDKIIMDQYKFKKRLRAISYYDTKMDDFIEVSMIKDNAVFLKDGTVLGVIKVKPIDFSILDDVEKEQVINNFNKFIKSLAYPCQIISRSVEINLDTWLYNSERKIHENKSPNQKQILDQYGVFKNWITTKITSTTTRNRVFYIIIPYHHLLKRLSYHDLFKQLYSLFFGKPIIYTKRGEKEVKEALKELSDRTGNAIEKLKETGVEMKRLNDNELLSLFSSYFTDLGEVDMDYITPIMFSSTTKPKTEVTQNA